MDRRCFDELARILASGTPSRRTALRLLAGGALGGLLARLGLEEAEAGCAGTSTGCTTNAECATCARTVCQVGTCCRPPGKPCTKGSHCCSGKCNKKKRCRSCPPGTESCGSRCVAAGTCSGGAGGGCQNGTKECPGKTSCFACCADTDCCPPAGDALRDRCLSRETPPLWKSCSAEGICTCPDPDRRLDCGVEKGPCQQCCTNDDCATKFADPNRVCTVTAGTASCTCSPSHPELCSEFSGGALKNVCTDTSSDMGHCGFCGNKCNPALHTRCANGQCLA